MKEFDDFSYYLSLLLETDSEDAFRYLIEMPEKEELTKKISSLYVESNDEGSKTVALEILREIRCELSNHEIENIARHSNDRNEWRRAVEARIYSDVSGASNFLQEEGIRFKMEKNIPMEKLCNEIINDL